MDEYINDMYSTTGDSDNEPDWVKSERESFTKFRDENKVRILRVKGYWALNYETFYNAH